MGKSARYLLGCARQQRIADNPVPLVTQYQGIPSMDARFFKLTIRARLGVVITLLLSASFHLNAATYRTANFVVTAPSDALAREIGESAEQWRDELSNEWIGEKMPNWSQPCKVVAHVSPRLGAGGATTFVFDRGEVTGWDMQIQGSRERVLDSVLPHEITHTVFASYFRRPLPRWADEGACTTVEHQSEIGKQERLLIQFLKTGKGIPFSQMFAMKEYPRDVLPLYAQGHSLTQFLLERRGKQAFMEFLTDGMRDENWRRAIDEHYGHENLYALQESWLDWVRQGRPQLAMEQDTIKQVAAVEPLVNRNRTSDNIVASYKADETSVYSVIPEERAALRAPAPPESVYDASVKGTTWR